MVLANVPALFVFDVNPLGPKSGLVARTVAGPLPGEWTIDPHVGFSTQAFGHRAALDLLHLRMPWWNPDEATGAPLAGDMISAAFFPPTLLLAMSNGEVYERLLLELLAGICTYLLLRRLALVRSACVAGAIAFALNGTFAWFADVTFNAVAMLPPLLLGVELAYARSVAGRRGGWWLLALAGAASWYAGFPETAYIDALFALLWFGWRCGCVRGAARRMFVGKGAVGVVVGTLLSAPLLIAFGDYLSEGFLGSHSDGRAGLVHLAAPALSQLVLPYVYGPIFAYGDAGLTLPGIWGGIGGFLATSLVLFALLGLFSRGRRGLRAILLVWIVLALARIYREPPGLGQVLGVLPGMSRVAFYRYGLASVELAVIVLAALGLDAAARAAPSRRRLAVPLAASLAIVLAAALEARPLHNRLLPTFGRDRYLVGSVAWGTVVVLAAAGILLVADGRLRARLAALVVVVDTFALFVLPQGSAPRHVTLDPAPVTFLKQQLGEQRFFTLGPLQPGYGAYFGLGSLNVNELPVPENFARYVTAHLDQAVDPSALVGNLGGARPVTAPSPREELLSNLEGYREAGVAYVLTPAGMSLPQSQSAFELVLRTPSTWIYHLAGSTPYYSVADASCAVAPAGRQAVRVSCSHPTRLTRHETDLRGWTVEIDGRHAPIEEVDGLFQGVTVPAGDHRVTFRYAPPHVELGYAALAAGVFALLVPAYRRRRASALRDAESANLPPMPA